ncbi:two-component system response regulator [Gammaproteobacteria bacterium 53_120_T64]|nr:two-component system response regulator [Gammaproteobacteria bacterium 53_120_T64]
MAKTILIVDDSSSVRIVLATTLKSAGYNVIDAVDGEDGLSKLTGEKIHLIISDVNMPKMDGITMVKKIKALPKYKFTPICMLTTESEESKMKAGKMAGAKAWIVKPFQPAVLLSAVEKLVLP